MLAVQSVPRHKLEIGKDSHLEQKQMFAPSMKAGRMPSFLFHRLFFSPLAGECSKLTSTQLRHAFLEFINGGLGSH